MQIFIVILSSSLVLKLRGNVYDRNASYFISMNMFMYYVMKELKEFFIFSIFLWIDSNDMSGIPKCVPRPLSLIIYGIDYVTGKKENTVRFSQSLYNSLHSVLGNFINVYLDQFRILAPTKFVQTIEKSWKPQTIESLISLLLLKKSSEWMSMYFNINWFFYSQTLFVILLFNHSARLAHIISRYLSVRLIL